MAKYNAFISYSRSADGELAPALQAALQRLAKPWTKRRALEVFRDETGLAVTPDLWASITEALDGSDWFVLLASPLAAESKWVNQEIERWLSNDPDGAQRILPVLTNGTIEWDADTGDFTAGSDAVPQALRGAYTNEPRYLDLSWTGEGTVQPSELDLKNDRFRQVVAEIAAPMHGVGQDELIGVDVIQHRRSVRMRWIASASLVLLAALVGFVAFLAVRSQRDADDTAALKASTDYARQSSRLLRDDPEVAALLAVEAWWPDAKRPDRQVITPEGESALRSAINELRYAEVVPIGPRIEPDTKPTAIAVSPDGEIVASIDNAGTVSFWNLSTGAAAADIDPIDTGIEKLSDFVPPQHVDFSPDGQRLVIAMEADASYPEAGRVVVADVPSGSMTELAATGPVAWLPDGSLLATQERVDEAATSGDDGSNAQGRDGGDAVVLFADTNAGAEVIVSVANGPISGLTATPDGSLVFVDADSQAFVADANPDLDGAAEPRLLSYQTGQEFAEPDVINAPLQNLVWAADPSSDRLFRYTFQRFFQPFTGEPDPRFNLESIATGDPGAAPRMWFAVQPVLPGTLAVSPDGTMVAAVDGEARQGMSDSESGVITPGRFVQIGPSGGAGSGLRAPVRIETNEASDIAWRGVDNTLVVASRSGVQLFGVRIGEGTGAYAIGESSGSPLLATWDGSGEVALLDGERVEARYQSGHLEGESGGLEPFDGTIALSPDGNSLLLTGVANQTGTSLIDLTDGSRQAFASAESLGAPVRWSPSGERVVFGTGQIVDVSSGEPIGRIDLDLDLDTANGAHVLDLRWTTDESVVIALISDGSVLEYDVASDTTRPTNLVVSGATVFDLASDEERLAIGYVDGTVDVVDRNTLEVVQSVRVQGGAVTAIDLSGDDAVVLSAGKSIALHDLATGDEVWSSDEVPAFEDVDWWLGRFANSSGQIAAGSASRSLLIDVADPATACGLVSDAAFERFNQIVDGVSACRRIDALRDAGRVTPSGPTELPPLQTVPTTVTNFDDYIDEPFFDEAALDEAASDLGFDGSDVDGSDVDGAEFDTGGGDVIVNAVCPGFTINETRPIVQGESGLSVIEAQSALNSRGFLLDVDGCFGTNTRDQLVAFQVKIGIEPSGALDDATWERLFES